MSNNQNMQYSGNLSILLRAPEALKNWKALAILAGTLLIAGLIAMLGGYIASKLYNSFNMAMIVGGIFFLLSGLVAVSGVSGAGILLMDQARSIELRSILDAFIAGAMSVLKFVLIFILDGLALLLFTILCGLLLLVCKIPGIGPVLYTVVFPLMILGSGLVFAALFFVVIPMTLPAIWEDNSVKGVYARRWALFENRMVQIVLGLIVLMFIVALVAGIVDTVFFSGFFFTTGLSLQILNIDIGVHAGNIFSNLMNFAQDGGNGYITAATLGGGLLFISAMAIPGLVYIMGINLIYLGAMEGLDLAAAEQRISQAMEDVKRRAEETKARAAAASHRAREAAAQRAHPQPAMASPTIAQPQAAVPATAKMVCPRCGVAITADEMFCVECGMKLK
jgi:hypothetical protein